jgi:hypothetical protein
VEHSLGELLLLNVPRGTLLSFASGGVDKSPRYVPRGTYLD